MLDNKPKPQAPSDATQFQPRAELTVVALLFIVNIAGLVFMLWRDPLTNQGKSITDLTSIGLSSIMFVVPTTILFGLLLKQRFAALGASQPKEDMKELLERFSATQHSIEKLSIEMERLDSQQKIYFINILNEVNSRKHIPETTLIADVPAKEELFNRLAETWQNETEILSSIERKSLHSAYQRIIGMGETAIPFILRELKKSPNHWFWALSSITGDDPIHPQNAGKMRLMAQDWLYWGEQKGYISK